jgi:glycerate 2-kinase
MSERQLLREMFEAAIAAASPDKAVPANLPPPPAGRTVVVGAGKAAASMARAVEAHWPEDKPLSGLVVTRYGHGVGPLKRIEVVEAAHPIPDAAGQQAAGRILDLVKGLGPDDLALCLISGGGSALLSLPAPGITLDDKQALNKALLRSGANINEINCVRKHLSAIKGGRLARGRASQDRVFDHFRRAGRRPVGDRLRPDHARYDDARRRQSRIAALLDCPASLGAGAS